ncbi:iron complex transport system permease protein [Paracoccus aminovorans]|uniref:Iron complex transport system permease protein n=1 Tax=Paracoccus aminovorans TaxID=34004 RepID=A0A1I2ZRC6_9RHOB|nr:iron ABC transporter permease [Paracoccus aminovorans]CQR84118.1 transport system permease [Paracoccus aminovorans]SFH40393.1 iron complex transport system permease protein [Paracoccus aminovorans]
MNGWLALGLIAALVIGIAVGPYAITPAQLIAVLSGDRSDPQAATVLWNIRLPRVLATAVIGAALAAAGAGYQTVFRNPLVSPDILGVSAGAGFGAVLGILLGWPVMAIQMLGFGTGLATVALVLILTMALRGAGQVLVMVLCGIAVGALAGAGISLVKLLADPEQQLPAITFWLMGSLAGVKRPDVAAALPALLAGLAPLLALRWRIGLLAMGDDEARSMGIDATRLRLLVVACATLMTAAAVAMAGVIGWVGLMVPHMARLLAGPRFDRLLPAAALIGAGFMVLVDTAARSIAPTEVPLGILTAVLGAPVFVWLLARGARAWSE